MKIAFVCQPWEIVDPKTHSGSIVIRIFEVARRLAKSEHVIVYSRLGGRQQPEETVDGVYCKRLDLRWDDKMERRLSPFFRLRDARHQFFTSSLYYRRYIRQVATDIANERCDVAHVSNFSQFAVAIRRRNPHIGIVLQMGCEWLTQLDRRRVERRLRSVDRIIAASDFLTRGIQSQFPHQAHKCATVPNGAYPPPTPSGELASTTHNGRGKTILFVGRVSPEKGLHVLVEAFRIVGAKDPTARLEIVGPEWIARRSFIADLVGDPVMAAVAPLCKPGYMEHLKSLVPADLSERVIFPGLVPHVRVNECYNKASIFVHPSICNEAFGMPIVEAMMNGLPVVSVNAGAQPELVENERTGIIVERNNPQALASAILRLLTNPELRERMGRVGQERALKLYTWERSAVGILNEFQRALQERLVAEGPDVIPGIS